MAENWFLNQIEPTGCVMTSHYAREYVPAKCPDFGGASRILDPPKPPKSGSPVSTLYKTDVNKQLCFEIFTCDSRKILIGPKCPKYTCCKGSAMQPYPAADKIDNFTIAREKNILAPYFKKVHY